jgi:hypothetical protein
VLPQSASRRPTRKRSSRAKGRVANARSFGPPLLRIGGFVLGVIAFIGSYVSIVGFGLPRLSVEPMSATDPTDPYTFSFKVQNQGSLDLMRVSYSCKVKGAWIDGRESPIRVVGDEGRWMHIAPIVKGEIFRTLTTNETDNVSCKLFTSPFPFMLDNKRLLGIVVSYRPAYYPFNVERQFTFSLNKTTEGTYQWLPVANQRE